GHEPVRRGVEHRESDVRRGARDQHDRRRQIAENAPAPITRRRRVRLGGGLAGQQDPHWKSEKLGGHYLPNIQTKWRTTRGVSRRRSAKSDRNGQVRLLKKWAATNSHESGLCRPPPQSHLRKAVSCARLSGYWSQRTAPPRTRQISRACGSSW